MRRVKHTAWTGACCSRGMSGVGPGVQERARGRQSSVSGAGAGSWAGAPAFCWGDPAPILPARPRLREPFLESRLLITLACHSTHFSSCANYDLEQGQKSRHRFPDADRTPHSAILNHSFMNLPGTPGGSLITRLLQTIKEVSGRQCLCPGSSAGNRNWTWIPGPTAAHTHGAFMVPGEAR